MSCPTLFGRLALEPLILFEPALNMRQGDIAHGRLGRDLLALIASLVGCWLLLKELGNRITGEAKVAGRCPLALAAGPSTQVRISSRSATGYIFLPPLA
jgi:hypothetical protein